MAAANQETEWKSRWDAKSAQFREDCELLNSVKRRLARAYMNQGDLSYEECGDCVDAFVARQPDDVRSSFYALIYAIEGEAGRYERM